MQYRVVFREITHKDLDEHCRYMPEDHEFEMHIAAIAEDAVLLDGVTGVRREGLNAIVVTTDETIDVLKGRFIPLLQTHWAYLRISSLVAIDRGQA